MPPIHSLATHPGVAAGPESTQHLQVFLAAVEHSNHGVVALGNVADHLCLRHVRLTFEASRVTSAQRWHHRLLKGHKAMFHYPYI